MIKRLLIMSLFLITCLLTLAACTADEPDYNEQLQTYIKYWNDKKFTEMYDMLSKESKKTYDKKAFVDRYKKIYNDLDIKDLKIKAFKFDKDAADEEAKSGKVSFVIEAKMKSMAGPIEFESDLNFVKEGEEDKENWYVNWNPGLIFPELKDGGKISIETTLPKRGEILDRNLMPLAINGTSYEIGVVPETFTDSAKQRVAELLGLTKEAIDQSLSADWVKPDQFVPLKTISASNTETYNELMNLPGVTSRETTGREYPAKEATAHLIGYVGQITAEELKEKGNAYNAHDLIGKRGLEQIYEDELRGSAGAKVLVVNDGEESVLAETPVKDGKNITLTIDVNLQEDIFNSYKGKAGTTAAINPKTGEALALVSSPSFDPNQFLYGISQSKLDKLEKDPLKPLINRFNATFAPGSVLKVVSAEVGLNNGTINPNEGLTINGLTWSNGNAWGNYRVKRVSSTEKPVDLKDALVRSDNIYFAMQAVKMGKDKYTEGLKKLGFAEKIPFAYPIKQSSISNSGNLDSEVLLANTSYGQGELLISPLHMALTYTPLFNNGNMLKPVLLETDKTGEVWHKDLLKEEDAKIIKNALREVIMQERGTAKVLKDNKVAISGKTGTAELKSSLGDEQGKENSWFVAYPTNEEDILIAMMIEDTKDKGPLTLKAVADILNNRQK